MPTMNGDRNHTERQVPADIEQVNGTPSRPENQPRPCIDYSGNLERTSLLSVLQRLNNQQCSGCLHLQAPEAAIHGHIYLHQGKVRHAQLALYTGKPAFYRLMFWKRGMFEFVSGHCDREVTITDNTTSLLLDSIHLQEQLKELQQQLVGRQKQQYPLLAALMIEDSSLQPRLLEILALPESKIALGESLVRMGILTSARLRELEAQLASDPLRAVTGALIKLKTTRTVHRNKVRGTATARGLRGNMEEALLRRLLSTLELLEPAQIQQCLEEIIEYRKSTGTTKSLRDVILKHGYLDTRTLQYLTSLKDETGANLISGYEVLEKVGEGAMSVVYQGRQESLNRDVAIKIFVPTADSEEGITRFMREAETASKLDHPNIVKAIDFGNTCGFYYFIMEFLEGQSLNQYIQSRGRLEEQEGLELIQHIVEALVHIWERGIVHRDIKPHNIMLTNRGIKLCDLGLAKSIGMDHLDITAPGLVMGTPRYMAPEAFLDATPNFRIDVYSLGMTLYEMFTGKPAFSDTTPSSILAAQQTAKIPQPRTEAPQISKPLAALIMKLLDKNPLNRCQEPQEILEDFKAVRQGCYPRRYRARCIPLPLFPKVSSLLWAFCSYLVAC